MSNLSTMKVIEGKNKNVADTIKFVRNENMGNGENAGYQHFPLFYNVFKNFLSLDFKKLRLSDKRLTHYQTTKFKAGPI